METQRILLRTLAVAVVIASVIWTTTAAEGQNDAGQKCCTKVSTAELTDPIINIRLHPGKDLPCVKAVIIETERGEFCCDPKQQWVLKKVKQFFKINS
ncbi:hypothetical protein QQF64_021826 [Cirrhinus molitorella]|uniref:Chemokine interleukin-8-like domain-containing protein n=1 Tax=Cirrhinus molitorella TaxID=172907 RepID=A0ABR3LAF1_9TELE